MLEVVFSDSVKGAMKHARKDVVYIGFSLDIGDITLNVDELKRREVFRKVWGRFNFTTMKEEGFFKAQRYDMGRLLNAASNGLPIRIWKSGAPYSTCGFYYVCDVLRNIDCNINVISQPSHRCISDNKLKQFSDWREVDSDELDEYLIYAKQLSTIEKKMYSNYWKELAQENSELRAIVNGKLVSVPEEHYDFLVTKNIPEADFIMARLIGELLGKYPIGVSDAWYAARIEKMIEVGDLQVIKDEDDFHPYGKVLRSTKK